MFWKRKTQPVIEGITAEAHHMANGTVAFKLRVNGMGVRWTLSARDYIPYWVNTGPDEYHDSVPCLGNDVEKECRRRKQQVQNMLDQAAGSVVVRVESC